MTGDTKAEAAVPALSIKAGNAKAHLSALLTLAIKLCNADGAIIVTPLDNGDHLIRLADGASHVVTADDHNETIAAAFFAAEGPEPQHDVGGPLLVRPPELDGACEHVLTVPVMHGEGECAGILQLYSRQSDAFTERVCDLAQGLAPCLASALAVLDDLALARTRSRQQDNLLRHMTDGVIRIDLLGNVASCNDAVLKIFGFADVPVGRSITRLLGDMNGWLLEAIDRVASERDAMRLDDVEIYLENEDRWIALDVSLLPVEDEGGRLTGLILVVTSLDREKALRQAMSRYVSPAMASHLLTTADAFAEGRFQIVTILFCDIRGFTGLSEQIGAVATVQMLNSYFSYMEDVITNSGGTIDKYIGDAIMAVFGSPEPGTDDAANGVQAATNMIEVLSILNVQRKAEGLPPIRVGIGLATGQVVAGNIGSSRRMDFTVIGDAVNLASRIEGMTKNYGADILIDGTTAARLSAVQRMRHVDRVRVKGQQTPTEIHQIAIASDAACDAAWKDEYEAAARMYFAGEWETAGRAFDAIAEARPFDLAARLMRARCATNLVRAPLSWQGVTDLDQK